MHALIASPFLGEYLVVQPGREQGIRISLRRYRALADATRHDEPVPEWLADAANRAWGMDLVGASLADTVMVRPPSELRYARASWEINKGCDYDCEHCYLGLKRFEGLSWDGKMTLLDVMRDAGVLWLQITGGEPFIDAHFPASYEYASSLGMMIAISSNGSQLSKPRILECLTRHRPYRLTLSVYGATAETYEGLTRSRGAFGRFTRGLDAAREAGLPVRLNIIVADRNAHELEAMRALADHHGFPHQVYTNMSPTISGGGEPLPTQAADFYAAADRSPDATPGTRSSTPTRSGRHRSARSAATPRSTSLPRARMACAHLGESLTGSCSAPAVVRAARSPDRVGHAARSRSSTRKPAPR